MNIYCEKFVQLNIVFLDVCEKMLHKLEVQNRILTFVESLVKVENYKVILKSVNHLQQLLKGTPAPT
jgi:hypothetical protein